MRETINFDGKLTKEEKSSLQTLKERAKDEANMQKIKEDIKTTAGFSIENFLGVLDLQGNTLTGKQLKEKLGGDREKIAMLQLYLSLEGKYEGKIDGIAGKKTLAGINQNIKEFTDKQVASQAEKATKVIESTNAQTGEIGRFEGTTYANGQPKEGTLTVTTKDGKTTTFTGIFKESGVGEAPQIAMGKMTTPDGSIKQIGIVAADISGEGNIPEGSYMGV